MRLLGFFNLSNLNYPMSLKRTNLSMPMTSAGIVGMSADMELSGIKMDPRSFIIAVAALVAVIKIAGYMVQ